MTNVNLYNLLKTDSPLHLPPHFKFVQNYFVLMKDIFFTYLNNLSDQKLETEHTKYIMKFYLASCIFQWKLTENLKPEDLFTLNKEQFIAKTGFTNPSLQSKIWIYYSDNILVKAAIHDTSPVLPFKRKLSQIEHEETLESPLKKQK